MLKKDIQTYENPGAVNIPTRCTSLADVKMICKHYGIRNSVEYRQKYKQISGLPAHPERMFPSEWISYYDLLDMPIPYTYAELTRLIQPLKLSSKADTNTE